MQLTRYNIAFITGAYRFISVAMGKSSWYPHYLKSYDLRQDVLETFLEGRFPKDAAKILVTVRAPRSISVQEQVPHGWNT